jgi:hypothetical protein
VAAWRAWAAGLMALSLGAGCAGDVTEPEPPPAVEPAPAQPLPPAGVGVTRSEASEALAAYYLRLQQDLLSRGLLRGDGGGPDAPFTDVMLARDFVRIALYDEYASGGGLDPSGPVMSRLRRWEGPIRMDVEFGPTVPARQQAQDRATIAAFAARLSRVTGLEITQGAAGANFHVLVVNEDDRRGLEDRLRALAPGIAETTLRSIINLPRSTRCLVVAFSEAESPVYAKAIAVIRAEHPDLLRTACVHEELAQGLGLANDHPLARPSIFNDNDEFGLLTGHDELLLRILYDPRLTPGMAPAEAAPVVSMIAAELMEGA